MNQPFRDGAFDAAYAIEATCHAPDRVGCYAEILRVTKPGGLFGCYEWCTTDRFEGTDEHRRIVDNIQVGNGLPGVQSTRQVLEAAREAGWEVLEYADLAERQPHYSVPWYEPLAGGFSLRNFRTSLVGVFLTTVFCYVLETLFILPRGTYNTQQFLIKVPMSEVLFAFLILCGL
jgi:sterol 24-C-methyltransferase